MGNCISRRSSDRFSDEEICNVSKMHKKRSQFKCTRDLRVFPRDENNRSKSFEACRPEEEEEKTKDKVDLHMLRMPCEKENQIYRGDVKRVENRPDLSLYIVTWNMNSKVSCNDLRTLLGGKTESFDFYVVGLQEAPHGDIASFIQQTLRGNYSLVRAATMQSLQLYIFGKNYLTPLIKDVRVDKIKGGGLGGVVGRQKGAVAISFYFSHTSFVFLSCHLAPHENNVEERNSQYQRISQTIFTNSRRRMKATSRLSEHLCVKKESKVYSSSLEKSDVVVWIGDLNYRIMGSRRSVGSLINQNLPQLKARDQLSQEAKKGEIFHGFCEGPLSFPPTYKYDIGTDAYDSSTKRRVPSWTDRILYKINSPDKIRGRVEDYDCIDSIKGSDHKPVKAHLSIKFRRRLVNRPHSTTTCLCRH